MIAVPRRVARWFVFKPKIQIWVNIGGSCHGIFYEHLVYFTVLCYVLWTFGIVRGNLVYFFPFLGILYQEKSGNPGAAPPINFLCLRSETRMALTSSLKFAEICNAAILSNILQPCAKKLANKQQLQKYPNSHILCTMHACM
jgi:hypothetical protein